MSRSWATKGVATSVYRCMSRPSKSQPNQAAIPDFHCWGERSDRALDFLAIVGRRLWHRRRLLLTKPRHKGDSPIFAAVKHLPEVMSGTPRKLGQSPANGLPSVGNAGRLARSSCR